MAAWSGDRRGRALAPLVSRETPGGHRLPDDAPAAVHHQPAHRRTDGGSAHLGPPGPARLSFGRDLEHRSDPRARPSPHPERNAFPVVAGSRSRPGHSPPTFGGASLHQLAVADPARSPPTDSARPGGNTAELRSPPASRSLRGRHCPSVRPTSLSPPRRSPTTPLSHHAALCRTPPAEESRKPVGPRSAARTSAVGRAQSAEHSRPSAVGRAPSDEPLRVATSRIPLGRSAALARRHHPTRLRHPPRPTQRVGPRRHPAASRASGSPPQSLVDPSHLAK